MYFLLFYDYVEDVLERRGPFRQAHLALVQEHADRGEVLFGGAYADPADGAVIVFKVDNPQTIEDFVANDPYVLNGLVTDHRIREWTVVAGAAC